MPIESEAQAIEALAQAAIEDGTAPSEVMEMDHLVKQARESADTQGGEEGTTEQSDSFIDPNNVPEELQPRYKEMQAAFTRKTQELAAERKAYAQLDEFGGLDAARQAVEFTSALANDPQYALQVHSQLSEALTQAGLTPAQASAAATAEIAAAATFDDEYEEESPLVKQLNQQLSEQKDSLDELKKWRGEQENIARQNQLQLQENEILKENPKYGEADIKRIYSLAYSTGGDLNKANLAYKDIRNSVLSDYIAEKGTITSAATGGSGEVVSEEQTKFTGLYDPKLSALVNERLAQEIAAEN